MKKRLLYILKWALLGIYLVVVLNFINKEETSVLCKALSIKIDKAHAFIDTALVRDLLKKDSLDILQSNLSTLNLDEIETLLEKHEAIKKAEVYASMDGILHIQILQRNPIMRIISKENRHYYMDEEAQVMSVSDRYTADVIVVNGYIPDHLITDVASQNDSVSDAVYPFSIEDLYKIGHYIYQDPLWKELFVQIYVNKKREIECVPRVGDFYIILGKPEQFEFKLKKLEAMYMKAFKEYGWKNYSKIDLRYSNQVVCTKK